MLSVSYSCDEEECRFDNSSVWTPRDHGVYNCIGECKDGKKCHLFVKEPEAGAQWQSTGRSRIRRPDDMDSPTDDPNSYKCECE